MAARESFIRWLKESGEWPAFKARLFHFRLSGLKNRESWYAAARDFGWTDNWRPPLERGGKKRIEEERGRRQTEAESREQPYRTRLRDLEDKVREAKSQEQSYPHTLNGSEHHPASGEHRGSGEDEDFDLRLQGLLRAVGYEKHCDRAEDGDFDRDLKRRGVDLPELSDATHYDDVEGEGSISDEDAGAADPEAERFLEMLSSSSDDPHESDVDAGIITEESPQESFVDDLLTRLERELSQQTEFAVERVLNELRIMFDVDGETLQALIAYHSEHGVLHARVFLPFVEDAAIGLLQLFRQSEFTGIICIENCIQESHYVIRRNICTASGSVDEFVNSVQQLLSEAVRASKLLRRYE